MYTHTHTHTHTRTQTHTHKHTQRSKSAARRDERSTQIHAVLEAIFANKTWDRLPDTRTVSKETSTADEDADTTRPLPPTNSQDVPLVSVCVQGGCGAIHTVYTTVKSGFPALLVSGSGKSYL